MTTQLGIVVLYKIGEDNEGLLDLHLTRIARHTTVPYTIHGSVVGAPQRCRRLLERQTHVQLHEIPPTHLRGADEHSYYLERLVRRAIDSGSTHVVVFHVDSFPIRDGWAEALVETLSTSCVFTTIDGVDTACLVFSREFLLKYTPRFLLTSEELRMGTYAEFVRDTGVRIHHSGTGFAFAAHQHGLRWHILRRSTPDGSTGAAVHGDLIFHLKGAQSLAQQARSANQSPEAARQPLSWWLRRFGAVRHDALMRVARDRTPAGVRRALRARLRRPLGWLVDRPRLRWHEESRDRLLADPEAFIEGLRR